VLFDITSWKNFINLFYPKLAQMFPNWSGWSRLVASQVPRMALFSQIIEEHKETVQENAARDFVDVYLEEIKKTTNPTSSFHPQCGRKCYTPIEFN